jgi:rhodanese-related sulfurtransferase
MKPSIRPLAIITVSIFGFLIILTQYANKSNFELTAQDIYKEAIKTNYVLNDTEISKLKNRSLIDIREPEQYIISHDPKAINIPLSSILNEEYQGIWRRNQPKILQSNDPVKAHGAWMLLTQLGVEQLYILQ